MPQATRELKRRIRGIGNTRKITKAMELVASSKMRRAVHAALATRAYAVRAWTVLTNLSRVTDEGHHPLLVQRELQRGLVIALSPDRGLAGALPAGVERETLLAGKSFEGKPYDVVTIGKKIADALRKDGVTLTATFDNPNRQPVLADVKPLAELVLHGYLAKRYDRVVLVWTDYVSALAQKAKSRVILPITRGELVETIEESGAERIRVEELHDVPTWEYLFEPAADQVLEEMLPRLLTMQLYQALLDATASEHAARMVAMRNASDAASDLIDGLTLAYNQARQASITADLTEISASRAALES